jgi:hypothetical protein
VHIYKRHTYAVQCSQMSFLLSFSVYPGRLHVHRASKWVSGLSPTFRNSPLTFYSRREVSVVFFSMCAVTATFSAASPFWNYCYATWEREKEKKNQCRLRVSYNACVRGDDRSLSCVSGACSSRVCYFLFQERRL